MQNERDYVNKNHLLFDIIHWEELLWAQTSSGFQFPVADQAASNYGKTRFIIQS